MKTVKFLFAALLAGFAFTSCNQETSDDNGTDTVIIKEEKTTTKEAPAKEEGSSIGFDVKTDKDGKVSGGVKGDIDLDDDK